MTTDVSKSTYNDLQSQARDMNLGHLLDTDIANNLIYFSVYNYDEKSNTGTYDTFQYSYSWGEGKLTIDTSSKKKVLKSTNYVEEVDIDIKEEIGVIKGMLNKLIGNTEVIKQFDDKTFTVVEPLYVPLGEVDGHGDTYKDENGPHDLVKAFEENKHNIQTAINHEHLTKCFSIVRAWVTTKECIMGDVRVKANQPLVELKYTEKAYELRKQGRLLGPSIGCSAWSEEVLKGLKGEMVVEPKRLLSSFDFSKKRHHLSLTTESVGGPASLQDWHIDMNEDISKKLSQKDLEILEDLDEEYTELAKSKSVCNQEEALSTSETLENSDAGVDNTLNKGNDTVMSEENQEVLELRKQVETMKNKEELARFKLDTEVTKSLAEALVGVEAKDVILKAMDDLVEASKKDLAEVTKSVKAVEDKDKTELEKAFESEEGEGGTDYTASEEFTDEILKAYRDQIQSK